MINSCFVLKDHQPHQQKEPNFFCPASSFNQRKNRISKNVSNELSVNRCMMAFLAVFLDAGHLYINDLSSHLFCRNCSACSHFDLSVFVSFSGVVFFYYVLYSLTYVESHDLARHQQPAVHNQNKKPSLPTKIIKVSSSHCGGA